MPVSPSPTSSHGHVGQLRAPDSTDDHEAQTLWELAKSELIAEARARNLWFPRLLDGCGASIPHPGGSEGGVLPAAPHPRQASPR